MPQIHTVIVGIQGPPGPAGGEAFQRTFTQSDLSIAGVLVVTHNLNSYPSGLSLWNASGELVVPDEVNVASLDTLTVYLESFAPLSGTWTISVTQ